jgi:hypothetical protein
MEVPNPLQAAQETETGRREPSALETQLLAVLETLEGLPELLERANAQASQEGEDAATTLVGLLSDINEHTELVNKKQEELAMRRPRLYEQSFSSRKRAQKLRLASIAEGVAEIFNEVGDALFLLVLWTSSAVLFLVAAVTLSANVLGRVWVVARELPNVDRGERRENLQAAIDHAVGKPEFTDEGRAASYARERLLTGDALRPSKLGAFVRGAFVYMIEPNLGMRLIKRTLVEREQTGTTFDLDTLGYVASEADAIALAARNNAVSGQAEVQTMLILITTEDMAELAIQVAYLLLISWSNENEADVEIERKTAAPQADMYFWIAVVGTVAHMLKAGTEAWETHRSLPRLRMIADGREKTFSPTSTDDYTVVKFVHQSGGVVRTVNLAGCETITDSALISLCEQCTHLRCLELQRCHHLTDAGVSAIGRCCRLLTELNLNGCTAITDKGAVAIGDGCPWLTKIELQDCSQVSDVGVVALARSRLEKVVLTNLNRVTDEGAAALSRCPLLRSVILQGLDQVTDFGIAALAKGCPDVRQLSLRGTGVGDSGIDVIAAGCGELAMISLVDCKIVTDTGLTALARGCSRLHALSLSGCTELSDVGIEAVAQYCPHVAILDLSNLDVGDIAVQALAANGRLERLYLEGTSITDDGMVAVASSCTRLSTLNLSCCSVTDISIHAMAEHCPHISRLKLLGCDKLTESSVAALTRCSQLIALAIGGCDGLTQDARKKIAAALPHCDISEDAVITQFERRN